MCFLLLSFVSMFLFFFFNATATTEFYTLSLHDALPISFDSFLHQTSIQVESRGIRLAPLCSTFLLVAIFAIMKRHRAREIHVLPECGEGAGGTMRKLVTLAVGLGLILGCSKARNDETIMNDIKAGLFSDARTKSANIDVVVKNGTATLVGEVPDENTRYEAFKIAKGTAGVVNVQDQMSFPQARGARAGKTAANAASAANAGSVSKSAREARREHESLPVRSLAGSANQSSYGASTQAQDSSQQ